MESEKPQQIRPLTRREKSFAAHALHVIDPAGHPVDPWADTEAKPRRTRIPKLTLQNVPRYIAAVAKALERGELKPAEANALLYAAQMLIAAWRALGEALPEEPAAKRIGFIQAAADALMLEVRPKCQQPSQPRQRGKI